MVAPPEHIRWTAIASQRFRSGRGRRPRAQTRIVGGPASGAARGIYHLHRKGVRSKLCNAKNLQKTAFANPPLSAFETARSGRASRPTVADDLRSKGGNSFHYVLIGLTTMRHNLPLTRAALGANERLTKSGGAQSDAGAS